ncbi:uncharacterized protein J4E88_007966 [Alternaria novae-zelandiae]|uniref:uncharacterized protein n=1 Tax=Alternaria novae-zelandiae TaxID=430562 RepID=UPI0020C4AA5E|nr:uncharacterized protein J4E88_007966 [Alternaria novae-zelandiae]KAI4675062.1 hypothetical protein J4E88_007966 [Alternaria novae-zelandiae]
MTLLLSLQTKEKEKEIEIAIHRDGETHFIEAIRKQIDTVNPDKIKNSLAVLSELSVRAAAFLQKCDFTVTQETAHEFSMDSIMYTRSIVSEPFSMVPLAERGDLARLDVMVLARALLHQAFAIAKTTPVRQVLAWRLHHWMAHCVKDAFRLDVHNQFRYFDIANVVTEVMRSPFRWQAFFAANPTPLANFLPSGWEDQGGDRFSYGDLTIPPLEEEEYVSWSMEDVAREPDSPRRSARICSSPPIIYDEEMDEELDEEMDEDMDEDKDEEVHEEVYVVDEEVNQWVNERVNEQVDEEMNEEMDEDVSQETD